MRLKQAMKKMKVKEIKKFYFDDYGNEWFLVERLDSYNWIIERHLQKKDDWFTLEETYRYDELRSSFKVYE